MAKTETNPLIHCDACGEDYSATYRRCPFCGNKERKPRVTAAEDDYVFEGGYIFDEIDREKSSGKSKGEAAANHGGKRLAGASAAPRPAARSAAPAAPRPAAKSAAPSAPRGNTAAPQGRSAAPKRSNPRAKIEGFLADLGLTELSPLKIAVLAVSFIVILAALIIVLKLALPGKGDKDDKPAKDPATSQSQPVDSTPSPSADPKPTESEKVDPQPTESQIPADQTAVDFVIEDRYKEFTISDKYPEPVTIKFTMLPSGSKGTVTWTSSDPAIATVDQNGTVTAVSKGTVTITGTLPGAEPQTCKVRSAITSSTPPSVPAPSPSASASSAPAGSLALNKDEFSISAKYPKPVTLKVTGADGTVTWTSSNSAVATVDQNGTVTQVGNGKCTITATDTAGNSDTCLVYCSGK